MYSHEEKDLSIIPNNNDLSILILSDEMSARSEGVEVSLETLIARERWM